MSLDISIIIPAKDEEQRLPPFLKSVIAFCQQSRFSYEIIVVDDGSSDKTTAAALIFQSTFQNLSVLTLPFNRGKGHALKRGFFKAQGRFVLFLDADGSTPVNEIERHLHFFDEGFDIVIGSRVVEDHQSSVKAKAYRRWMGIIFNQLVHTFLIKDIKDTQCGFKMFRRECIRPIWGRTCLEGFGFDLEVLYLAQRMNYKIKEVAVNWTHVDGSKISLVKDSLRMLINIFQIKNWHFTPINLSQEHMSASEIASMYKQEKEHWWFKAKGQFIRKIIGKITPAPKSILDAGCGTGHNMEFLREGSAYTGCDVVFDALQFCRHNNIKSLTQCHLEQMPFKTNSFDLIISLDVIEHIPDPYAVIAQFKNVLKNNGKLLITVPAFRFLWSPHDESISHMRRYDRRDLINTLKECGFTVDQSGYLFCATFLPVAGIRLLRKVFVRGENIKSDTHHSPSGAINAILNFIFKIEEKLLLRFPFPFGTSVYAIASKAL